ncbi:UNVERIFIED_CONTAM: hypothetical protein FKN15_036802 [Acipenser sinensis]
MSPSLRRPAARGCCLTRREGKTLRPPYLVLLSVSNLNVTKHHSQTPALNLAIPQTRLTLKLSNVSPLSSLLSNRRNPLIWSHS